MSEPKLLDVQQPKYKPLSNEQRLAVREAQFQIVALKEQFTNAIKQAEDNLFKIVSAISAENGVSKDAKIKFELSTLRFVDAQ